MAKLSERDVCTKFITPALVAAGWDLQTQIREEVIFSWDAFSCREYRMPTTRTGNPIISDSDVSGDFPVDVASSDCPRSCDKDESTVPDLFDAQKYSITQLHRPFESLSRP